MSTRSTIVSPRPPSDSGARMPTTPISTSWSHSRGMRPVSFVHASRRRVALHSLSRRSRTASRNASWSSVNANLIPYPPHNRSPAAFGMGLALPTPSFAPQPKDAFGDDVALDLVGPGIDGALERKLAALLIVTDEFGVRAEHVERELVQL